MEPLQARALDPIRAVANAPGVIVECCSYSHHEWHLKTIHIACHESLLLRSTEADPENVRSRRLQLIEDLFFLFIREVSKRGRIRANDLQARKSAFEFLF